MATMEMETPPAEPVAPVVDRGQAINDAQLEQMLSEKLMNGYVLMEATCPKCAVPLVKNNQMVPRSLSMDEHDNLPKNMSFDEGKVLSAESFEQPFKPVDGVPLCVGCDSHVITQEAEIAILEQSGTLKDKGAIYVALECCSTEPSTDVEEEKKEDDEAAPMAAPIVDSSGKEAEVINLEDVTEDDVIVGSHRSKFVVDISATSFDNDGVSHVEMTMSPKMGDADKPIVIEEIDEETEQEDELEQGLRREIATKVLGAKMLQGWTLKEKVCGSCSMPMMEHKGKESCPVCPALAKRAKKLQKEKAKKELLEQSGNLEQLQSVRGEVEARAFKEDEEATVRAEERKRAIQEEKERLLAMEKEPEGAAPKTEDEEPSPDNRASVEEAKLELERLEAIAKEEEERRKILAAANGNESELAATVAEAKALQDAAAEELAKEAETIEAFDEATMADDKTEAMKKDLMVEEHRKKMAKKLTIDEQVTKLEEERMNEAMEARRIAEEKRIESESRMIAALEADAALKALAAEDAIRKAKEALAQVSDTKQMIISQTIEMAEKEAIAETEQSIKAEFEGHNEPVILQSDSQIYEERWETLRLEGRAIMTRRVLQGWTITPEACLFKECHNNPLIEKDGVKECVVCGGCGDGTDVDIAPPKKEEEEAEPTPVPPSVAKSMADNDNNGSDWLGSGQEEKFEQMRKIYAKEIGKKMLMGWSLVNTSCPKCVMPMMMDDKGNTDICIVKGCKGAQEEQPHTFDASTIATKEMAELEDVEGGKSLSPVMESAPSEESDIVSRITEQAPKQQKKKNPVVSSDPPAFKPNVFGKINRPAAKAPEKVIPLPDKVDFADADAIRELVGEEEEQVRDDSSKDASIDTVANLFLKSPHGYDFQDFGRSMGVNEVKELVEIFLVTNVDKTVSDAFKFAVAKRILAKMSFAARRDISSPPRLGITTIPERAPAPTRFHFEDDEQLLSKPRMSPRKKPFPENGSVRSSPRKLPPRSPGMGRPLSPGYYSSPRSQLRSPRDDASFVSRASTVASDAMESIYDRIEQCKKKLLDPTNSLDEQIATAALLEKLAQAAVAVKEMEYLE